jgi:hypothetical protein
MIVRIQIKFDLKPLEDIFRASIFKVLKDEGKIDEDVIIFQEK